MKHNILGHYWQNYSVYIISFCLSILLSIIIIGKGTIINNDAVVYLESAKTFLQHNFQAGLKIYPWPLYSSLIAILSALTGATLLTSAYILNSILVSLTVVAFIAATKAIGANKRQMIFAALVVLAFPYLNHTRDMIIRDFGYYAFILISFSLFIKFFHSTKWSFAILWNFVTIIATLFRIEGFFLYALLPLAMVFNNQYNIKQRIYGLLKLYTIPILLILGLVIVVLIFPDKLDNLGRLNIFYANLLNTTHMHVKQISGLASNLANIGINHADTYTFLSFGFIGMLLKELFTTLGIIYVILSLYALLKRLSPIDQPTGVILTFFIAINLCFALGFLTQRFFLSSRYIALLAFILMLFIPFCLDKIYADWQQKKPTLTGKTWVIILLSIAFLIMLVTSVWRVGPNKNHIIRAITWTHTHTSPHATLLSNNNKFYYLANRPGMSPLNNPRFDLSAIELIKKVNWKHYNYLVIILSRHKVKLIPQVTHLLRRQPICTFTSNRGAKALVFYISGPKPKPGC